MTASSAQGTCYGFTVRSSLPFACLRPGPGDVLEVVEGPADDEPLRGELVFEWDKHGFHVRVYGDSTNFQIWIDHFGWFLVDPGIPRITVPEGCDDAFREELIWGLPVLLCLLHRGELSLHAAAVEVDGRAVVLAAPGTFGKSTLAAAFHQAGHRVLAEDMTCLRLNGHAEVVPGPAMLRLRRDVDASLALTGASRDERGERVRYLIDEAIRGDGQPVPVRAIVLLRSASDEIVFERETRRTVISDLYALTSYLRREQRARCFEGLASLVDSVPIWNLRRPLTLDALAPTMERIVANA